MTSYLVPFQSYHRLLFKFWTLHFWAPLWGLGGLAATSSAHWKAGGLPISVNLTFFTRCYSRGTTSEYQLKIGIFAPTGSVWPKISGTRDHPQRPFFLSKTRLNDGISCGIRMSQSTRLTNGQTDGQKGLDTVIRKEWFSISFYIFR